MTEITFTEFAWTAAPLLVSFMALWGFFRISGAIQEIVENSKIDNQATLKTMVHNELTRMRMDADEAEFLANVRMFKTLDSFNDNEQTALKR